MTKMHFQAAADMVKAIRIGAWTYDLPEWAHGDWNNRMSLGIIEIDTVNAACVRFGRLKHSFYCFKPTILGSMLTGF